MLQARAAGTSLAEAQKADIGFVDGQRAPHSGAPWAAAATGCGRS